MKCKNCGKEIINDSCYCENCGYEIIENKQKVNIMESVKNIKSIGSKEMISLIIAVVLLIVSPIECAIANYFTSKDYALGDAETIASAFLKADGDTIVQYIDNESSISYMTAEFVTAACKQKFANITEAEIKDMVVSGYDVEKTASSDIEYKRYTVHYGENTFGFDLYKKGEDYVFYCNDTAYSNMPKDSFVEFDFHLPKDIKVGFENAYLTGYIDEENEDDSPFSGIDPTQYHYVFKMFDFFDDSEVYLDVLIPGLKNSQKLLLKSIDGVYLGNIIPEYYDEENTVELQDELINDYPNAIITSMFNSKTPQANFIMPPNVSICQNVDIATNEDFGYLYNSVATEDTETKRTFVRIDEARYDGYQIDENGRFIINVKVTYTYNEPDWGDYTKEVTLKYSLENDQMCLYFN